MVDSISTFAKTFREVKGELHKAKVSPRDRTARTIVDDDSVDTGANHLRINMVGAIDKTEKTFDDDSWDKNIYKYLVERKRTKLNMDTAYQLRINIHTQMLMHMLAARYFQNRHFWFFNVPKGILITASGMLAFFGKENFAIGTLTLVIAFLEGIGETLSYGSRAKMHEAVSIDLRDIENDLDLLKIAMSDEIDFFEDFNSTSINASNSNSNNQANPAYEGSSSESFESFKARFQQSLSGCKSPIPLALVVAFDKVHREGIFNGVKSDWAKFLEVYSVAYLKAWHMTLANVLVAEIETSFFFPLFLPNSKTVSARANKVFWEKVKSGSEDFQNMVRSIDV